MRNNSFQLVFDVILMGINLNSCAHSRTDEHPENGMPAGPHSRKKVVYYYDGKLLIGVSTYCT